MHPDICLQRAHKEERGGPGVAAADDAGIHGAPEIAGDDHDAAPRWAVGGAGIERHDDRARAIVHVNHDVLGDHLLDEWNEAFGDPAQHDAGIRSRIDVGESQDEIGRRGDPSVHGFVEKLELRVGMAKYRGGGDPEFCGDVGQRRPLESLGSEHPAGGVQELLPADARRASHL